MIFKIQQENGPERHTWAPLWKDIVHVVTKGNRRLRLVLSEHLHDGILRLKFSPYLQLIIAVLHFHIYPGLRFWTKAFHVLSNLKRGRGDCAILR